MAKLQAMPKAVNVRANIPNLIANNRVYCTDEKKAVILMSTFLPKQSEPVLAEQRTRQQISRRESQLGRLLPGKKSNGPSPRAALT
jgi:hypothetical protein